MKRLFFSMLRYLLGGILVMLAVVALAVMLAYYQEPVAMLPGFVCAVSFIGACVCFIWE